MNISLSKDIHSITELKRNTKTLIDQMHETGRPIVLTQNGKANAVMMDINLFEKLLMTNNMAALLQAAEEDIKANRTMDARKFIKQFKDENNISS